MKHIMKIKVITILAGLAAMMMMAGCAAPQEVMKNYNIITEKISSMDAKITKVGFYTANLKNIYLTVKLKRQFFVRNAQVPGHLRIEIINLQGKLFKEAEFNYGRKNNHSEQQSFTIPLPVEPELISKVRVIHHQAGLHNMPSSDAVWRNVN